jgi:hypothetical protein
MTDHRGGAVSYGRIHAAQATSPPRRRSSFNTVAGQTARRYDFLSALSLSWLADDWSELGGLDGVADDGDDGEDCPDEAIEPDGLAGLLLEGVDFDMLDPLGGVVCDVFWRSPHAAISNAETTATDNAEAFISSPFVAIAN